MIEINLMYELYVEEINIKLQDLKTKRIESLNSKKTFEKILIKYEEFFIKYTDIILKDILKSKDKTIIDRIKFPIIDVLFNGKPINVEAIKLYILKYVEFNKKTNYFNNAIANYKSKIVSKKVYVKVIKLFNNLESEKIVKYNETININPYFGELAIVQKTDKKPKVDWGKSMKKKEEIINEGLIPYYKKDEEEALKNNEEYNGVKWLIKRDPFDFFLYWFKNKKAVKFNPLLRTYKFIPARGNYSLLNKILPIKENKEESAIIYTRVIK